MPNKERGHSKRLKISTGDDKASGATGSHIRKSRKAAARAAALPKTEEEKRLEEQIFGLDYSNQDAFAEEGDDAVDDLDAVPYAMDWLGQKREEKLKSRRGRADSGGEDELGALGDDQLFFTDAPGPSTLLLKFGTPSGDDDEDDDDDGEESSEDASSDDDDEEDRDDAQKARLKQASAARKPLWHDPADASLTVSLAGHTRLRKLRQTAEEDVVSGREYEARLRQQFRKIHPTPAWAEKARLQKLKGPAADSDDSDPEAGDVEDAHSATLQQILQSASAGIRQRKARGGLPPGELEVTRLRDANQVDKHSKSPITALQFHKSASVLYTTSEDRRLKLYQVDGSHNPLLQSIHLPELPIQSAAFHPSGSSILMTGPRPFFYSYDLQAGRVIRSPRGLWSSGLGGSDGSTNDKKGGSMEMFRFSPDGRMVAVAGRRGYVHLLDWGTDGKGMMAGGNGGQIVGSIKINTGIKGLTWNHNGTELVTVGDDAVISSWDIGTRKCLSRWNDDGGFAPSCVETDRAERYFAIGSHSGIVNVYDSARAFSPDLPANASRKPLRSIMNLTTHVDTMRYNHSSEILALASKIKKDSLKLVHLPTMAIFSNWPTSGTPLGHVSAVDFSRNSEYVAVGNHKGRVLLYSLGHYAKA